MTPDERNELFKSYQDLESKITQIISEIGMDELVELDGKSLMDAWLDWQDMRNKLNEDWVQTLEAIIDAK